jgi:hypothetical protein
MGGGYDCIVLREVKLLYGKRHEWEISAVLLSSKGKLLDKGGMSTFVENKTPLLRRKKVN